MARRLTAFLAALMVLSSCAKRTTLVESGNREQVLHIGNKDEPDAIDPQINTASSTSGILDSLFQGLVQFANDGQTVLPGVAERWDISADGLTYTFHFRADAKWSNGQPVTSMDFRDSFLRLLDPQLGCEYAGYAFPIHGARDFLEGRSKDTASVGVRAPDPRTLVLVLDHPASYLLKVIARAPFYPVYMPSLDANGGRGQRAGPWTRPGVLVSNGPFTLAEWKPNAYLSVRRNPSFWDAGRIRLREVRFYPTDDAGAEERAFRAGQLHVTYRVPETKVPVYEAAGTGELHLQPTLRTNFITFNVARAPFTDPRVRRAFSLAVDRVKLVRAALGKLGTPAFSLIRPGTGGFSPAKGFRFDPTEAAAQLGAAGFPRGAGLPAVELTLNGSAGEVLEVAEALQQMWLEYLGVRVTVHPLEFKAYLSVEREKQFQFLFEGYSYLPDAHDLLEGGVTNDPENDAGASNPEFDAAVAASDSTTDEGRRRVAFDAAEAANAREVYFAPVYFTNRGRLIVPSVRGWRDNGISYIDWREISLEP